MQTRSRSPASHGSKRNATPLAIEKLKILLIGCRKIVFIRLVTIALSWYRR